MSPLPRDLIFWKDAILKFLRDNPALVASNTRGYFRFLENRGILPKDVADKLCALDAERVLPKPEVYVRTRRELIEKGLVFLSGAQQSLLKDEEAAVRTHYREDKRGNPLWG